MFKIDVEIKKTIKLSEEDILDILSAAFSSCFWARIDNTTEAWDKARAEIKCTDPTVEDLMVWILNNGYEIIIIDREDEYEVYYLDKYKLLAGIKMAIENGFWDGADVYDVDGEVGDAIIQYALFEELVYG